MKCNKCQAPTDKCCNRCQYVFYCNRQCQSDDWKQHRKHCCLSYSKSQISNNDFASPITSSENILNEKIDNVRIVSTTSLDVGVGIIASQMIPAHSLFHVEDPWVFARSIFAKERNSKYVDDIQKHIDLRGILLLAQFLRKRLSIKDLHENHMILESPPENSDMTSEQLDQISDFFQLKKQDVWKMQLIIERYNHLVSSTISTQCVGQALYKVAGIANHSCNPNTLHFFDSKCRFVMYSLCDIHPGTEITINYGSVDLMTKSVSMRQSQLVPTLHFHHDYIIQNRGFVCKCERCLYEKEELQNQDSSLNVDEWNQVINENIVMTLNEIMSESCAYLEQVRELSEQMISYHSTQGTYITDFQFILHQYTANFKLLSFISPILKKAFDETYQMSDAESLCPMFLFDLLNFAYCISRLVSSISEKDTELIDMLSGVIQGNIPRMILLSYVTSRSNLTSQDQFFNVHKFIMFQITLQLTRILMWSSNSIFNDVLAYFGSFEINFVRDQHSYHDHEVIRQILITDFCYSLGGGIDRDHWLNHLNQIDPLSEIFKFVMPDKKPC